MSTERPFELTGKTIAQLFFVVVLIPMLPLLITQRWNWWGGWAFAIIFAAGFVLSRLAAARAHPDLLAERYKGLDHPDMKEWDRRLAPMAALGGVLIPLVAGLDLRFGWSEGFAPGAVAQWIGLLVMVAGYVLGTWALVENRFFSGVVRIQHDRGHHVVTTGPYAGVRHPGYVGAILSYFGAPVLLSSAWSVLPALLSSAVLVYRTRLEDATLQEELAGYAEYAKTTRWRLLPGVW